MKNLTKGSKVKVIKGEEYHEFSVGDIVTIWSQSANGGWYATGEEGASGWLFEEDMEEVEEEEIKYVPEVGDIVRIVNTKGHYGVLHGLGLVINDLPSKGDSVVICVAHREMDTTPTSCVQHISYECLEKVGEQIKDERGAEPTQFNVLDKVWVKGTIESGVDSDGDYEVRVDDYGDSTTIYVPSSQLKRR